MRWTAQQEKCSSGNFGSLLTVAQAYYEWVAAHENGIKNHVLALESDAGVFDPTGYSFDGAGRSWDFVSNITQLFTVSNGEAHAIPGRGMQQQQQQSVVVVAVVAAVIVGWIAVG